MTDPLRKAAEGLRSLSEKAIDERLVVSGSEQDEFGNEFVVVGWEVAQFYTMNDNDGPANAAFAVACWNFVRSLLQPTDAGEEEPTGRLEQPAATSGQLVSTANGGGAAVVTAPTDPLATAINRYAGLEADIAVLRSEIEALRTERVGK